jgi:hypothetical protein
MTDEAPDSVERFFAAAQMAVGALIFGLCGACTVAFAGSTIASAVRYPGSVYDWLLFIPLVGFFGVGPTVLGFFMMRSGYRWFRGERGKRREPPKPTTLDG